MPAVGSGTLLIAGVIAAVVAASYAYVAWELWRRGGFAPERRPLWYFAVWWGALAANLAGVSATYFLAANGALDLPLQVASSHLQRLLLSVSMTGLLAYLLFILTGRDLVRPLAIVYAAYFAISIYSLAAAQPDSVFIGAWRTDINYANAAPAWTNLLSLALIVTPPIVCGVAFLVASRRASRPQRYRMRLVSFAIVFWWVVAVAAGQRALLDMDAFQASHRFLSLLAALVVLAAYHPPRWARAKLGAETYPLA